MIYIQYSPILSVEINDFRKQGREITFTIQIHVCSTPRNPLDPCFPPALKGQTTHSALVRGLKRSPDSAAGGWRHSNLPRLVSEKEKITSLHLKFHSLLSENKHCMSESTHLLVVCRCPIACPPAEHTWGEGGVPSCSQALSQRSVLQSKLCSFLST